MINYSIEKITMMLDESPEKFIIQLQECNLKWKGQFEMEPLVFMNHHLDEMLTLGWKLLEINNKYKICDENN